MKKFIIKCHLFMLPFLALLLLFPILYTKTEGDLCRIGRIAIAPDYREVFTDSSALKRHWVDMSKIQFNSKSNYDILTIGDSFSSLEYYGYQNYLSLNSDLSVLNFNYRYYNMDDYNPIQFVNQITSGNILDTVKVDYIILQGVERYLMRYLSQTNFKAKLSIEELLAKKRIFENEQKRKSTFNLSSQLHNAKSFYFNSLLYQIDDKAFFSSVYKMPLTQPLFSTRDHELLFIDEDISSIAKNTRESIIELNETFNMISEKLKAKNVSLIVMLCPDKYDLYRDYIKDNRYPENPFFKHFNTLSKNYIYVDVKSILSKKIKAGEKDIYYADDTHWSPKTNKLMAQYLSDLIAH